MSDLREQLARRLGDVMRPLPGREALATPDLLLAADEVIRQMEWARKQGMTMDLRPLRFEGMPPLTLAPENWQP